MNLIEFQTHLRVSKLDMEGIPFCRLYVVAAVVAELLVVFWFELSPP